ncbi:MAG: DNA polymerase domain-containing protein [Nitrospirota bacterium]
MTDRGWLFDLYPDGQGMRLWFLRETGSAVSLWEPYAPTFYVRGTRAAIDRALARIRRFPVEAAPVERIEFWTEELVPVLEVRVRDLRQYSRAVSAAGAEEGIELFTCDIPLPQRYAYDRGVFPLAYCSWDTTPDGTLRAIEVNDDPWALDYPLPPLSVMELKLEGEAVNPRHGWRGRLEATFDGETRLLEGSDPHLLLETLAGILRKADPDVILTQWGDSWLLPELDRLERRCRIALPWHRNPPSADQPPPPADRARSYFSYGPALAGREAARFLSGRWHIDARNTFIFRESGLEGLVEIARLSRIPVQQLARTSIGTAMSSIELLRAHQEGILIHWRKQEAEEFKAAEDLLTTDKGGLVFLPPTGVHGDVAELDFASLYPTIMAKFNVSPETLDCPCCPGRNVPEIGRRTCARRRGLIPRVLSPLIEKRARYKSMRNETADPALRRRWDRRQNALKWILVTSFGYLGYKNARFGRIEAHEAVTAYGRELLLQAKETAEAAGFSLLHAIVDSIWIRKPGITERETQALAEDISRRTGIAVAVEGIYRWLIFPPSRTRPDLGVPNRYAGVFRDGTIKVRGLELRRRDTPRFVAETQEAILAVLARAGSLKELGDLLPEALSVLDTRVQDLLDGRIAPAALAVTKQVSQDPEAYTRACDTAVAAQSLLARGIRLAPGENVQMVYSTAGGRDPASRVRPLAFSSHDFSCDTEKYLDLTLRAAGAILGPLGWDASRLAEAVLRERRNH